MSEWIKCSERMPLEIRDDVGYRQVKVLVSNGHLTCVDYFCAGKYPKPWAHFSAEGELTAEETTHWMPLPEPPKE